MAIDYGSKRSGIAVSDPLRIISTGLDTVKTTDLLTYLEAYFKTEEVDILLIGLPLHKDGNPTFLEKEIKGFIRKIADVAPHLIIERIEESFSSVRAKDAILKSGASLKKRRDKGLLDKMSAVILLQDYMEMDNPYH